MSMGWDYPPGVTGREYQISGPDEEWEEERECAECGSDPSVHFCQAYNGTVWTTCSVCQHVTVIEERDNE